MKATLQIVLAASLAPTAFAQWTVTVLHPANASGSTLTAGGPGFQGGNATVDGVASCGKWTGSSASWVNLAPPSLGCEIRATGGNKLAGFVLFSGRTEASLWDATTRIRTNLNPPGVVRAELYGASADQQVGWARLDPNSTLVSAVVWNGSATSFANLSPAGAIEGVAYDVDAGRQVGSVLFSGRNFRASLWSGSAASRIDLNPPDALRAIALGIHGDQQVGWAIVGNQVASLWRGSPESWVNLNPPGASWSVAAAVHDGVQVGVAFFPIVRTAALWRGSVATYENLSLALPPNLGNDSEATSVWTDANTLFVGGYATDVATGRPRAVIWSRPLVRDCIADFNADGFVDFFDYADFVTCFETSECPPGRTADANGDGFVDFFDYADFVLAFETAC